MREFWVIGGEYASTVFDRLAAGAAEERYGPYRSYNDALAQWRRLNLRRIEECQVRYQVVETAVTRRVSLPSAKRILRQANG